MKKAYVKPVMESEAFVANEYVAGCWEIVCQGGSYGADYHDDHGSFIYVSDKKPNPDYFDGDRDGFVIYIYPPYGNSYSGEIGGVKGPHPVEIIDRTKPGHPNASV